LQSLLLVLRNQALCINLVVVISPYLTLQTAVKVLLLGLFKPRFSLRRKFWQLVTAKKQKQKKTGEIFSRHHSAQQDYEARLRMVNLIAQICQVIYNIT